MFIYDSVKKEKVLFQPIQEGKVSIYVCGPTVYDDAHLGHARSSLAFDLLSRTFKSLGYDVTLGKNFTDIDDKIIKKVEESGSSLIEITSFYIQRYLDEMKAIGVQRADIEPKATESIEDMAEMIQNLIDNDFAYITSNGDVYFDISKDSAHGSIANRVFEGKEQTRIEHFHEKRDSKDFVLWKGSDKGITFKTSFSIGRPGWHIECSAMIAKHFKGTDEFNIDIHGGGADLLFPHHENEATQSRAYSGHELSKYWMHNGFVQLNGKKMSKSLGNSFFLKDSLAIYDGEIIRNYLNSIHYRSDFNYSETDLILSKYRLDTLYRLKKRVYDVEITSVDEVFKKDILDSMSDDLNISVAWSIIDEMIIQSNKMIDQKEKRIYGSILANIEFLNPLLGIGYQNPIEYFQLGVDPQTKNKIKFLISKRDTAKKDKDYELADNIRDNLSEMKVSLIDTPNGTIWETIVSQ